MRLSTLQRSAFAGVCTLALLATVSASGPVPDSELQFAPPEFGVIQFTSDEAFIDLPVPLAEAWKTTLEVTASLISQVRGDLPYLENNGRIVAGDLWVAVEAQGAPGATWTRIRVAITPDASGYGQVRAEVLLDAIADRLEPPAPAREPARFSYPPPVPAAENVPVESVTNNYYYGSGPYDGLPSNVYVPTYAAPAYYPVYYSYPAYSSFGCSPWAWNSGWWFGWGGPWCNPWGSSFSLWYGNNWSWSWSACYGSVYASGGWNGWWGPWDCGPSISIGWWGWDDCDDWNDGGNWDDDVSGGKGDDIIIIGDDNVIITGDGDDDGLVALDARQTGLRSLPQGDITLPGTAAGGDAGTDRTPRVTDRASRRASEPLAPVVVTRTERGPRPRTPVAEPRTSSERTGGQPEIARPSVVVVGSTRDSDEGREGSGPVPTSTSPSRSSKKAGPTVVKLGSAPYSARVAPAPPPSRSAGTVATTQGGAPVFTPSAPSVSQGQDQGRTGGTTTTASHPYSNPYTSAPSSGGSSPSGKASSGGSTSVGRSSAPAPRAPSTPAAAPRSPAPSAPTSLPSRSSAPSVSSRSSAPSPSGGGSRGPSGGSPGGGKSSGGSKGPR